MARAATRAEAATEAAPAPVSIPFLMPILLLRALAFFAAPNFCTGKRKHFIKKLLFYLPRDRERVRGRERWAKGEGERGSAFVRGLWRKFTHRNMILHLLLILTLAIIFWPGLPCRAAVYPLLPLQLSATPPSALHSKQRKHNNKKISLFFFAAKQ